MPIMYKLPITEQNKTEFKLLMDQYNLEKDTHLNKLSDFMSGASIDLRQILNYGLPYLPNIIDVHGKKNLNLLENFYPQVVRYYEIVSELSFIPEEISDVCSNLSLYADGVSLEINHDIYNLDPDLEVKNALATYSQAHS